MAGFVTVGARRVSCLVCGGWWEGVSMAGFVTVGRGVSVAGFVRVGGRECLWLGL